MKLLTQSEAFSWSFASIVKVNINGHFGCFGVFLGSKQLFGPPRRPVKWLLDIGIDCGWSWGVVGQIWVLEHRF